MNHTAQNGHRILVSVPQPKAEPGTRNWKKLLLAILFVVLGGTIAYQQVELVKARTIIANQESWAKSLEGQLDAVRHNFMEYMWNAQRHGYNP
jgi:hypothetical protein